MSRAKENLLATLKGRYARMEALEALLAGPATEVDRAFYQQALAATQEQISRFQAQLQALEQPRTVDAVRKALDNAYSAIRWAEKEIEESDDPAFRQGLQGELDYYRKNFAAYQAELMDLDPNATWTPPTQELNLALKELQKKYAQASLEVAELQRHRDILLSRVAGLEPGSLERAKAEAQLAQIQKDLEAAQARLREAVKVFTDAGGKVGP